MKRPFFIALFIYLSNDTKTIKYVDQKKQDNFSCKHEKTLKFMEFSEGDEHFTVALRFWYGTTPVSNPSQTL